MNIAETKPIKDCKVKQRLEDILLLVSWREIAHTYLNKPSSWLYHKLDSIDGNDGKDGLTEDEKENLRKALYDVARQINEAADNI